jgi:hypothetical protein
MVIEYSVAELKYYYNNLCDYSADDVSSINILENALTDSIDKDVANNSVYHIFPLMVGLVFATFVASTYIATM